LSNTNVEYRRCKLYEDILLAFYNTNIYDIYESWLTTHFYWATNHLPIKNRTDLFEGDETDFRYRYMLHSGGYSLKWVRVSDANALWYITDQYPLLPVIRMSEVFYIMCEYLADNNLTEAITLLNTLRIARGASQLSMSLTKDEFLTCLYNDATREFIAEGQTFYLYKRLNKSMYNGAYPIEMTGKYVVPLPDSETITQ